MSELLFLLILCSGGCFGAVCLGRRFEQMLPLTCGLCALWVFLFGLVGLLGVGPVLLLPVALSVYGYCAWRLWKSRDFAGAAARLFTPACVCFLLAVLALLALDRGVMFSGADSDEYGHWGLAVKEMLRLRDFSTSALAVDQYANYPPIMPCFQYILQRFLQLRGDTQMSEWHMVFCTQLFCLSFMLPIMKYASWRRPISALFGFGVLCAAPMVVFPTFYVSGYVDQVLGVVFAYAMVTALTAQFSNLWEILDIGVALSVLMLTKDSGAGFACIVLLTMVCMCATGKQALRAHWRMLALLAAFALVPKLLWSAHVAARGCVSIHASTAGPGDYLRFLTLRDASGYRYGTISLFLQLLYRNAYFFELFNRRIPYIYVLMGLLLINYLLRPSLKRHGILDQRASTLLCPLLNIHIVVYIAGLLYVYLFRMPAYEAVGLSSMDRYLNTVIGSVWMVQVTFLLALYLQAEDFERSFLSFLLTCILLLLVPISNVMNFASRGSVRDSQQYRAPYEAVASTVRELAGPEDRICVISQATYDRRIFIYSLYPSETEFYYLGDSDWELDYQTELTCDELTQTLKDGFAYLVLFQLDDYFMEHYTDAFVNPEEILPHAVYRVDPETGLASLAARAD